MSANEGPAASLLAGKGQILVVSLHLAAPRCKKAPAPRLREGVEAGVEYAGCEMWGTEFQAPKHYPRLGAIAEDRAVSHSQWDVRVLVLLWIPAVPGHGHAGPHSAPEQLRALLLRWKGGQDRAAEGPLKRGTSAVRPPIGSLSHRW